MKPKERARLWLTLTILILAGSGLAAALVMYLPAVARREAPEAPGAVAGTPETPEPHAPGTPVAPAVSRGVPPVTSETPAWPAPRSRARPRSPWPHATAVISRPERPQERGVMAVIIDDAGNSLDALQPFLDFPGPIAIAVLPHLSESRETARRVLAAGKVLLLHLPMEPLNGENPGPEAIMTGQSDAEIEREVASALASVPGAQGVNNHMGSRATSDERVMRIVMGCLKKEGKFFVDSRTTADSVAREVAARVGVPFLARNVFIDNDRETEDIQRNIDAGVSEAASAGSAVLIGHIHSPQIIAILKMGMPGLRESGVRLVSPTEILQREKHSRP